MPRRPIQMSPYTEKAKEKKEKRFRNKAVYDKE
jgi:hypothetical protein